MNETWKLLHIRLNLFDGDGGGSAGAPAAQGNSMGAGGADPGQPVGSDGSSTGNSNQAPQQPADGGGTDNTAEERRKAYFDMVRGDYKEIHDQEFQRELGKRMRGSDRTIQQLQKQVEDSRGVLDTLFTRYKVEDGDLEGLKKAIDSDTAYWEEAASEAGMSVEQYRRTQELERQVARNNREKRDQERSAAMQQQLQKWDAEAQTLKTEYPDFDLSAEVNNTTFMALLRNGFPMKNAYESAHVGELIQKASRDAAQAAEKRVTDNIRARGTRPPENGSRQQASFVVKTDVSKLSKKETEEYVARARKGEHITFT